MAEQKTLDSAALQSLLRERLAKELKKPPGDIDLDQPADALALDSLTVVEICMELGNSIQGREIQIEQWWNAESLRALCDSFAPPAAPAERDEPAAAAEPGEEPAALGAPLQRADAGRALLLLLKVSALVEPGERHRFPGVSQDPDLLSVAYRQVDEATGKARNTLYYRGSYLSNLRAWVTRVDESGSHDIYVLNTGTQTVEVTVAAWTSTEMDGLYHE